METLELIHTLGFSVLRFGYPKPSIGAYPCCLGRFALYYGVGNGFTSGNPCSGLIDLFTKLGTDAMYAYLVLRTLYREVCPVDHVPSTMQSIFNNGGEPFHRLTPWIQTQLNQGD